MVCLDGFIISHTMEGVELLGPEAVRQFVGEYDAAFRLLDTAKPITVGPLHLTDYYFECKRQVVEAMRSAQRVIGEVSREYGRLTGREYGLLEAYRLDDAEVAIVALGSTCGTAKVAADRARKEGLRAGVLKLRSFRPFPGEEIAEALRHVGAVAVLDRSISYGLPGGPLFHEVRSFVKGGEALVSYVYGLGGRDITPGDLQGVFADLAGKRRPGQSNGPYRYIGLRES
jgi:pyruvate ferredoxin oxidoreductase alpha subunit